MKPTTLLKKLDLLNGNVALDIGARNCSNSQELVNEGYIVDAIDIKDCPIQCTVDNINYIKKEFENFIPSKKYDLIIARHIIPFLNTSIETSVSKIVGMLNNNGVLYFSVFGNNDEWSSKPDVKISSLESIRETIKQYGVTAYEAEEYYNGKTYSGIIKKWHVITVVLVKN